MISVHEYELADGKSRADFVEAVRTAESRGLFDIEGLREHEFLLGVRGAGEGEPAALWRWESRQAWEELWGPAGDPKPPAEYPERWREWEALLHPLLSEDPDEIRFTSYRELDVGGASPDGR